MIRAILFANSQFALPTLAALAKSGRLAGVIVPAHLHEAQEAALEAAEGAGVPSIAVEREELDAGLPDWIRSTGADVGLTLTFPFRIPAVAREAFPKGIYNFHPGRLPEYRGPDPIFWQIRSGDRDGALTVHRMDDGFDTGPVLLVRSAPIAPGETYGIYLSRLSHTAVEVARDVLGRLESAGEPELEAQPEGGASARPHPRPEETEIDWSEQGGDEIENLVNACNPTYHGAGTWFRGSPMRVLEVAPADLGAAPIASGGTIVHVDPQNGIFVLCRDSKYLRLNVLSSTEGILSGFKLAALGVRPGEKLGEKPDAAN